MAMYKGIWKKKLLTVASWSRDGAQDKGAREALAALVSRREGAPVGSSGVVTECYRNIPEHTASG
jgi:hypothetical protein